MKYDKITDGQKPITLLLKGVPGSGKTKKAIEFPSPVLFNFDNNLSAVRKESKEIRDNLRIVHPRLIDGKACPPLMIWKNFIDMLAEVTADDSVRTIIIDSLTTLSECLMDMILKSPDPSRRVEIQHWGDFSRYMKWLGEDLLCATDLDKNVIFIAHETEVIDKKTGMTKSQLNLGGNMKFSFDLYFTDCWRTRTVARGNDTKFWVRTMPSDSHNAKCSLDLDPDFIWDDKKNEVLKQIK